MALLGQGAVVPACVKRPLDSRYRRDGVRNDLCSTHAIDAIRLDNVRPARRRQMARRGEEEEGRLPSAPLCIPVNLFSKFQVDSPWRIMTTVDFRRAPERRARWVARSSMVLPLGSPELRLLRALSCSEVSFLR